MEREEKNVSKGVQRLRKHQAKMPATGHVGDVVKTIFFEIGV